jgi:tetratricopeptide (TPR) repeat protein
MKPTTALLSKISAIGLMAVAVSGCGVEEMQKVNVQANLREAARLASIGQTEAAKTWVDRAIAADPGNISTYVSSPQNTDDLTVDAIFISVGDYRDAEFYDSKAATKYPNDYRLLSSLMTEQQFLGETAAEAQTATKLVLVLEDRIKQGKIDGNVLATLADGYWTIGNRQKALATVQRATTIYITNWNVYNHVAYEIAQVNSKPDLAQALNYANIALSDAQKQNTDDEEIAAIRDTIGWIEYRQGNYKQAEIDINNALEVIPREGESHYHLAMIYLAEGNQPAAKAELTKALLISPDYADAKTAMAQVQNAPNLPPVASIDPNNLTNQL